MPIVDVTNQRFGRLVVLKFAGLEPTSNPKKHRATFLCQCDCGKTTIVSSMNLRIGGTKSCGCIRKEATQQRSRRYKEIEVVHINGKRKATPEYTAWASMKHRCYGPNNDRYKHYGGRGIQVCERWHKFENFLADMGRKPSPSHSLDRINVDDHYGPLNCRWATPDEQRANKRKRTQLENFSDIELLTEIKRRNLIYGLPVTPDGPVPDVAPVVPRVVDASET